VRAREAGPGRAARSTGELLDHRVRWRRLHTCVRRYRVRGSEGTVTPLVARSPARSYRAVTGSGRRHYTPGVTSERDEPKWLTAKEQEAWRLYMDGNNRLMSALSRSL